MKIVYHGDSILKKDGAPDVGLYHQLLAPQDEVINGAIAQSRLDGLIASLPGVIANEVPDHVVLNGGVNDVADGASEAEIISKWNGYAAQVVDAGIPLTIVPILPWNGSPDQSAISLSVNEQLEDTWSGLSLVIDPLAFGDFVPQGSLDAIYSRDGIHLNGHGAQFLARIVTGLPNVPVVLPFSERFVGYSSDLGLSWCAIDGWNQIADDEAISAEGIDTSCVNSNPVMDFSASVVMNCSAPGSFGGIVGRVTSSGDFYRAAISTGPNKQVDLYSMKNGVARKLGEAAFMHGDEALLQMHAMGPMISVYLNGREVIRCVDGQHVAGLIGISGRDCGFRGFMAYGE